MKLRQILEKVEAASGFTSEEKGSGVRQEMCFIRLMTKALSWLFTNNDGQCDF